MRSYYGEFHEEYERAVIPLDVRILTGEEAGRLRDMFWIKKLSQKPAIQNSLIDDAAEPEVVSSVGVRSRLAFIDSSGTPRGITHRNLDEDRPKDNHVTVLPLSDEDYKRIPRIMDKLARAMGVDEKIRLLFLYTPSKTQSRIHTEPRTPSLNICLQDSGTEVRFFDEDSRFRETHTFKQPAVGRCVVYNTALWHQVFNDTDSYRLVVSVNAESHTGSHTAKQTFTEVSAGIVENIKSSFYDAPL